MNIIDYTNNADKIKIEDIVFHGPDTSDSIEINWEILYGCNYKCSYCFGQDLLKKDFTPIEKLKHAVDQVLKINKKYYTFTLFGGEVTYHPDFLELVEYIYSFNKKTSVLLISNASKPANYFERLLKAVKDNNFMLNFSIHFEYAKLEHIKELIILFNKYKKIISINFMVHPEYMDKVKNYFEEIIKLKKEYYFLISLEELREGEEYTEVDHRYNQEDFEWIDKARKTIIDTPNDIKPFDFNFPFFPNTYYINKETKNININHNIAIRNNLKSFKDFYCLGGTELIRINRSGQYQAAACTNFPAIGNIYEEEIDLFRLASITKCHIKQCGCHTNDINSKFRDINEAKIKLSEYRKENVDLIIENSINKIYFLNEKLNKLINTIAWWIPNKKMRDKFKNKFLS